MLWGLQGEAAGCWGAFEDSVIYRMELVSSAALLALVSTVNALKW